MSDRPHVHVVRRDTAKEPPWPHSQPNPNLHMQWVTVDLRVYWPGRIDRASAERSLEAAIVQARREMDEWFTKEEEHRAREASEASAVRR